MTQEVCDKPVNRCYFVFDSIPDWYKTQETYEKVVSENPFLIVYCPDKYKALRMCRKAVDHSLAAFNLFPIDLLQVK